MSFSDTREAIEQRFQNQWQSRTPIKTDNIRFTAPQAADWVGVFVRESQGQQVSINANPLYEYPGRIIIQIFSPEHSGGDRGRMLGDIAARIFRHVVFSYGFSGKIYTFAPSLIYVGTDAAGWYQYNLEIPYIRRVYSNPPIAS